MGTAHVGFTEFLLLLRGFLEVEFQFLDLYPEQTRIGIVDVGAARSVKKSLAAEDRHNRLMGVLAELFPS